MEKRREEKRREREEKRREREEKRREEKRREEKRREEKPDSSTHLNSRKTNTNFLEKHGNEIPQIPDHLMSKTMENRNVLIISFNR